VLDQQDADAVLGANLEQEIAERGEPRIRTRTAAKRLAAKSDTLMSAVALPAH